jgi:hypothetical protein
MFPLVLLATDPYSGVGTVQVQMELTSQHEQWGWHPAGDGWIVVEATADPEALTLTYHRMTITVTNLMIGFTNDFTAGFGRVSRVETTLIFDPIVSHATNLGTYRLTPAMAGVYEVARNLGGRQVFADLTLSGRYQIRGLSETVSGTFALPFAQGAINGRFPNYVLDTSGFPQRLVLVPDDYYNVASFDNGLYGTDFSGTVDGVRIDMDLRLIRFASRTVTLHPNLPRLDPPAIDPAGRVVLTSHAFPGEWLVLQASSDLEQWVSISTNLCGDGLVPILDGGSDSFSHRFYRLLSPSNP